MTVYTPPRTLRVSGDPEPMPAWRRRLGHAVYLVAMALLCVAAVLLSVVVAPFVVIAILIAGIGKAFSL